MKKAAVVFGLSLLFAVSAFAQEWSAEQKEIIAHIKACWDGWYKGLQEKNFDLWLDVCPCEKNTYWWIAEEGAPRQIMNSESKKFKEGLHWQMKRQNWLDLRPLSIKIDGDVALVHFYAIWIHENYRGEISQIEQKRFEVFRKKAGRWTFLGGMTAQ
jgi:hypothetical protein